MNGKKKNVNPGTEKTRIAVLDDHPLVLEGLAQLINLEDDLLVCAMATSAKETLQAVKKQNVDLVIVDMLLEKTTGDQVTEKLKSLYPGLHILILSVSDDLHHIRRAFQAGAGGYITKDEASEEIIVAIRRVLKGQIYLTKKLSQKFSRQTITGWILESNAKIGLGVL